MKVRLNKLLADYGPMALVVYLSIFALSMSGFFVAIKMGVAVKGTAAGAGTLAAAWLATKVIQPVRIGATLVMTPVLAHLVRRLRAAPAAPAAQEPSGSDQKSEQIV